MRPSAESDLGSSHRTPEHRLAAAREGHLDQRDDQPAVSEVVARLQQSQIEGLQHRQHPGPLGRDIERREFVLGVEPLLAGRARVEAGAEPAGRLADATPERPRRASDAAPRTPATSQATPRQATIGIGGIARPAWLSL